MVIDSSTRFQINGNRAVTDTVVNSIIYVNKKRKWKQKEMLRKKTTTKKNTTHGSFLHYAHCYRIQNTTNKYVSEYKIKMIRKNSTKAREKNEEFKIHY